MSLSSRSDGVSDNFHNHLRLERHKESRQPLSPAQSYVNDKKIITWVLSNPHSLHLSKDSTTNYKLSKMLSKKYQAVLKKFVVFSHYFAWHALPQNEPSRLKNARF